MRTANPKNLSGLKVNRITVLDQSPIKIRRKYHWKCRCECGTIFSLRGDSIVSGHTKSCGCLLKETATKKCRENLTITHGMSYSTEYQIRNSIINRCKNKSHIHYKSYGGRGITVCPRWLDSFEAFLEDMGPRPSRNHSIDRIDNNKGYSKENCRWATAKEQGNNRRDNRNITFNGKTMTLTEWASAIGIEKTTLHARLKKNWSIERALTEPLNVP